MNNDKIQTIFCFTGENEKSFIKKLTDRGMSVDTSEHLLLMIKSHICDVIGTEH
jgi:hypothetical protein